MEGYVDNVHGILRNYEDDREGGPQLLQPPYSRPFDPTRSTSNYFRPARPAVIPSYQQRQSIRTPQQDFDQASETIDSSLYDDRNARVLDDYGEQRVSNHQSP